MQQFDSAFAGGGSSSRGLPAPDAMVIVDRTGNIPLVNSQTEKLLGHSRKELLGRAVEMPVPPRLRHPDHRHHYFTDPRPRGMGGDRDGVLAEGFDGDITRPITPETFVPEVEGYLRKRG